MYEDVMFFDAITDSYMMYCYRISAFAQSRKRYHCASATMHFERPNNRVEKRIMKNGQDGKGLANTASQ